MAGSATCAASVYLLVMQFCCRYRRHTMSEFAEVNPVLRLRQVAAVLLMHFMIAVALGISVYVILFHGLKNWKPKVSDDMFK